MIRNQNGSATVESISSLALLIPLIVTGLTLSYLTFAQVWCNRTSYEATVCLASNAKANDCESRFRKDIRALPIGRVSHLELTRNSDVTKVDFRFGIGEKINFKTHYELSLPLTSSASRGILF